MLTVCFKKLIWYIAGYKLEQTEPPERHLHVPAPQHWFFCRFYVNLLEKDHTEKATFHKLALENEVFKYNVQIDRRMKQTKKTDRYRGQLCYEGRFTV
jgi:hypothetical protein